VWPTCLRQTTGGKPMEKASTRIPNSRAKRKCPSSWMKTRMPRARAIQKKYERMLRTASMQGASGVRPKERASYAPPCLGDRHFTGWRGREGRRGWRGTLPFTLHPLLSPHPLHPLPPGPLAHHRPCGGVGGEEGVEAVGRGGAGGAEGGLDETGDRAERYVALEAEGDGGLVGGGEGGGGGSAAAERVVGEAEGGETAEVGRLEVERAEGGPVHARVRGRPALGVREGVLDGHPHVRHAELRLRRAVAEGDEGVDDGLGVDEDGDPLRREVEEPPCLDHLQPLVGERGRVDGDLGAHAPVRVRQRLRGRDGVEGAGRAA